jgi:RNA polymerase sigma-70 factor (ECF subfamily)
LARACRGDEVAFRQLWETFQPRLVRYLRTQGASNPEDIASETWLRVVRDLPSFSGDATKFGGWLFTIGRHQAIDAARQRRRRPVVSATLAQIPDPAAPDDPAADAFARLSLERVVTLLRGLPPDQREAVALRAVAGLAVREVAQVLGKSEGAVRIATHRGLRKLAARLAEDESAVTT